MVAEFYIPCWSTKLSQKVARWFVMGEFEIGRKTSKPIKSQIQLKFGRVLLDSDSSRM